MADENTSPDDLISELWLAAREIDPVGSAAFVAEARDELAAYREEEAALRASPQTFRLEGLERRLPEFVVPERYQSRAEIFVVFEVFVRFFVDPVIVTSEIPALLTEVDADRQIARLEFRRFGEEPESPVSIPRWAEVFGETQELVSLAGRLGVALFGDNFRAADFWERNL